MNRDQENQGSQQSGGRPGPKTWSEALISHPPPSNNDPNLDKELGKDQADSAKSAESEGRTERDAKSWTDDLLASLVGQSSATMPVDKDSEIYNMRHPKRGKAVIFNHAKFENGQSPRNGTERDEQSLQVCLTALGFHVIVHRDLKRLEIFEQILSLKKEDHSNNDCLLVVVLSHGEQNKIYSKDSDYKPEDLWDSFTPDACPTLAGKPKIFFIQACRGDKLDTGTKMMRTQVDSLPVGPKTYVVPNRADFLVVYSTVPGYYSWRNTTEGSWFVQSLVKVLLAYKNKKDLLSMLTIVAREVGLNFESNVPGSTFDKKKQIPMISSTLIREIYFS